MKKIMFFICFVLITITNVKASCSYSEISRLKAYANNINISYDYRIENDTVYFKTIVSNITPELYIIDNGTGKKYLYSDTNNGELIIDNYENTLGDRYVIYSSIDKCYGNRLLSKYYSFPRYNIYYGSKECEGIENFYLCKKWVPQGTSFNRFYEIVEEYRASKNNSYIENDNEIIIEKTFLDKLLSFYANYYYYFLLSIILVSVIVIFYQTKKNKFDL